MSPKLADIIQISDQHTAEDASVELTALITSAVNDDEPPATFAQIHQAILPLDVSLLLDPLSCIPLLLPSPDPASVDILTLIGTRCSAREVVIVVQEAIEHVKLAAGNDDEHDGDHESERKPRSWNSRLQVLVDLASLALPRVAFRKKSASETMRPALVEMVAAFREAGPTATRDEGRKMIRSVSTFEETVLPWTKTQKDPSPAELETCKDLLKTLMDACVSDYGHCIQSSLAKRSFEKVFPRLAQLTIPDDDWEEGAEAMQATMHTYSHLDASVNIDRIILSPNQVNFILFTHSEDEPKDPDKAISQFMPIIVASLQSNTLLDETLSVLLKSLSSLRNSEPPEPLNENAVFSLSTILPPLACAHPDGSTRHFTFRVLSLVLACAPAPLRMQILKEITEYKKLPLMRAAAIGLVKEAVMEGLSMVEAGKGDNIWASKQVLQAFGPVLLRPDPPDLLNKDLPFEKINETPEAARMTECLGFFYLLLLRDRKNLTGIRDRDVIANAKKSFLEPLRKALARWSPETNVETSERLFMQSSYELGSRG